MLLPEGAGRGRAVLAAWLGDGCPRLVPGEEIRHEEIPGEVSGPASSPPIIPQWVQSETPMAQSHQEEREREREITSATTLNLFSPHSSKHNSCRVQLTERKNF